MNSRKVVEYQRLMLVLQRWQAAINKTPASAWIVLASGIPGLTGSLSSL
jgi:hypothetical protein